MAIARLRSLISLCAFLPVIASAQFQTAWQRYFNGPNNINDNADSIAVDALGNIYVVGTVNDFNDPSNIQLLKYDPNGTLVWDKTFDGETNGQDIAFGIALGGDGSVNIVGRTITAATSSDIFTAKYRASDGALLWTRLYDGPAHSVDTGAAIAADAQGNVFVTGEVWNDAEYYSNGDYATIKYDAAGNKVWDKLYDGQANFIATIDRPVALLLDGNGDVIVTGESPNLNNVTEFVTVKYGGATGDVKWESHYIGTGAPTTMALASNGDVFVGGGQDAVDLLRYNGQTGALKWSVADGFPHAGFLRERYALTVDPTDNPAIAVHYDPDSDDSNLNQNVWTTKYNGVDGTHLWSVQYGGTANLDGQYARSVTSDPAGNIIMVGVERIGPGPYYYLVQKYGNLTGDLMFSQTVLAPNGGANTRQAVLDGSGNLIIGSSSNGTSTSGLDISVLKLVPTSNLRPVSLTISPSPAWGGSSPIGRVQLDGRPGTGGQSVTITENSSFVTAPGSMTVAKGNLSGTFAITTANPTYSQTVTVTARIGVYTVSKTFVLNKVAVKSLALTTSSIPGGTGTEATITLNGPAPAGGLRVAITDNSVRVSTVTTVVVPAGATSATFMVNATSVPAPVVCTLRAYSNGQTGTATLTVNP